MLQATKIQMPATTALTPNKEVTSDSTTNEDKEDEDLHTIEDEVASITTEATPLIIKTELTVTLLSIIIYHNSRNRPTRSTLRKQQCPDKFHTFAATPITSHFIVIKGDQQIETSKYHTKLHQKNEWSMYKPMRPTTSKND